MPPACFLNAPTAALPRSDEQRTRQYLPLPREQKGCSFLRTGEVPRRGQTLCPLLGVFFCFVFLHGQENEGLSGEDILLRALHLRRAESSRPTGVQHN